jgi:hypothetical protein
MVFGFMMLISFGFKAKLVLDPYVQQFWDQVEGHLWVLGFFKKNIETINFLNCILEMIF